MPAEYLHKEAYFFSVTTWRIAPLCLYYLWWHHTKTESQSVWLVIGVSIPVTLENLAI